MTRHAIVLALFGLLVPVVEAGVPVIATTESPRVTGPLTLKTGDRVVMLGGTFAERLVSAGYF